MHNFFCCHVIQYSSIPSTRRTQKTSQILKRTPAGVKKRGEYALKTKQTRQSVVPVPQNDDMFNRILNGKMKGWYLEKIHVSTSALKNLLQRRVYSNPSTFQRKAAVQRMSSKIQKYLEQIYTSIMSLDRQYRVDVLLFVSGVEGRVVTPREIETFIQTMLNNIRQLNEKYHDVVNMGFDEIYDVPLYVFDELVQLQFPSLLTPYQRMLFSIHHDWIRSHTPQVVAQTQSGKKLPAAFLSEIRGTPGQRFQFGNTKANKVSTKRRR